MARFYADEQFPRAATNYLRLLGHDVLMMQEAGNANQEIPDDQVLAYATAHNRAVLTIPKLTKNPKSQSEPCKQPIEQITQELLVVPMQPLVQTRALFAVQMQLLV
jgi:Domain of unknown function (DUF5615)